MSCNHPLTAFYTGSLTENGKPDYVIGRSGDKFFRCSDAEKKGHHISPSAKLSLLNGLSYLSEPMQIPCGHCVGCRMEHAKQWKVRCCLESMCHDNTWFITLTYRDSMLPYKDGQPYLRMSHMTKFWKRFRKVFGKCRYFYCGEYGETTFRPHFHAIVFGSKFSDLETVGRNVFKSKALDKVWSYGLTSVSRAEPNCIAYVCGYVEKKQNDPMWSGYPVKPFVRMSRRPAIGSLAMEKLIPGILSSGKVYGNFNACHWSSVPRSFVRKLETLFPEWFEVYKKSSLDNALISEANTHCVYSTTDVERIGMAKDKAMYEKLSNLRSPDL